ncbi:MAG TPA: hypothetical protein VMG09_02795 [Bacteroidota bacterium]|nr:hypothetical protein [Bacteroidota bacterium]
MKRFFQSGSAFVLLAVLFLVAGATSVRTTTFVSLGIVFLLLALAVRKKNAMKRHLNPTTGGPGDQ